MSSIPKVSVSSGMKFRPLRRVGPLKDEIEAAAARLASCWPELSEPTIIEIVSGDNVGVPDRLDPRARNIAPKPGQSPAIHFGIDFMKAGMGDLMLKRGAERDHVILHTLAHEIYHLDEPERMAAMGIDPSFARSPFARGASSALPPHLQAAIKLLSGTYPRLGDLELWQTRPFHISDEGAADLSGLLHMRKAQIANWNVYAHQLIAFRRDDSRTWSETSEGREFSHNKPYKIADVIEAGLAAGCQTGVAIQTLCWQTAIDELLSAKFLPHEIFEPLAALRAGAIAPITRAPGP